MAMAMAMGRCRSNHGVREAATPLQSGRGESSEASARWARRATFSAQWGWRPSSGRHRSQSRCFSPISRSLWLLMRPLARTAYHLPANRSTAREQMARRGANGANGAYGVNGVNGASEASEARGARGARGAAEGLFVIPMEETTHRGWNICQRS